MAGEEADAAAAGVPDGETAGHVGVTESVGRLRGLVFEAICGASTVLGIAVVAGLLAYVARDAFRLTSADTAWHLTFLATLGLPTLAFAGYVRWRDRAALRVGYTSLGVSVVALLVGGGLVVVVKELQSPFGLLAIEVALLAAAGAVLAHNRLRPEAALERLVVLLLAPVLAMVGIPPLGVDYTIATPLTGTPLLDLTFSTPGLLASVRDLVYAVPVRPPDWLLVVLTVTVPAAVVFGRSVAARRDDDRGVWELLGSAAVVAAGGALLAPTFDVAARDGALLATAVFVPTAVYVEAVGRRREGHLGLLVPAVVVVGLVAGVVLTNLFGFAGPKPWLDFGFLTNAHSRTPADAGIYPALVGSVLIVLVIAASAFPVGVGAAIYLEEYAPTTGRLGRIVELIEINIGNLAGVPSIVYGLLGLALFVKGVGLRAGIVIVGGLTVGLLILPIVIISAQEALRAVPDSTRNAAYGMGATRWQTVRTVVLPEALPGILTGTILALGRAIGETAPLLMIGIASSVRTPPSGFFEKTGAMPRQIFSWSSEIQPEFRFGVLAAGVVTLVVVLLIMNGTAIVLRNRYQRGS